MAMEYAKMNIGTLVSPYSSEGTLIDMPRLMSLIVVAVINVRSYAKGLIWSYNKVI